MSECCSCAENKVLILKMQTTVLSLPSILIKQRNSFIGMTYYCIIVYSSVTWEAHASINKCLQHKPKLPKLDILFVLE